jgi:hypothetical protein
MGKSKSKNVKLLADRFNRGEVYVEILRFAQDDMRVFVACG